MFKRTKSNNKSGIGGTVGVDSQAEQPSTNSGTKERKSGFLKGATAAALSRARSKGADADASADVAAPEANTPTTDTSKKDETHERKLDYSAEIDSKADVPTPITKGVLEDNVQTEDGKTGDVRMEDLKSEAENGAPESAESKAARLKARLKKPIRVNELIERGQDALNSSTAAAISGVASASIGLITPEISNLRATCDVLNKTLDVVAQAHPFVGAAVAAFKTAIRFELTRRENDKRMRALHVSMKDMMSVVGHLQGITTGHIGNDGVPIDERLKDRMDSMKRDMDTCAIACGIFSKKKVIVKLMKSTAWETQLIDYVNTFKEHRNALNEDLAMHTSVGVFNINKKLASFSGAFQSTSSDVAMLLLFQQLQSPEDRKLRKYIESRGGPDVFLNDETNMAELLNKTEKNRHSSPAEQMKLAKDIQQELSMNLKDILAEDRESIGEKFMAIQEQTFSQMELAIRREGDRVIKDIISALGPRDRLRDPIVFEVWTQMGWKGSAKARHVVLALRGFLSEYDDEAQVDTKKDKRKPLFEADDSWTLEYINGRGIQSLLEAIDEDASSFVTVSEMNAFTSMRPLYWRLPQWMVYWIVGFPLSLQYYAYCIRAMLSQMRELEGEVLPSNWAYVDNFMGSTVIQRVETLLAGAYDANTDTEWDSGLFDKFQQYIADEETRIRKALQTVKFKVDTAGDLALLLGSVRLEKHLLPLIYVVFERSLKVLKMACQVPIHREELVQMVSLLDVVEVAIRDRIGIIKAMSKMSDASAKAELRRFSCGLYYYVDNLLEFRSSPYRQAEVFRDLDMPFDAVVDDLHQQNCEATADDLYHPSQPDTIPLDLYADDGGSSSVTDVADQPLFPQQYIWRGVYTDKGSHLYICDLTLEIPTAPGGTIKGQGEDAFGVFTINGTRSEESHLVFEQIYPSFGWKFVGTISDGGQEITGVIGNEVLPSTGNVEHVFSATGNMTLQYRPTFYWSHRPQNDVLERNRPLALWRYAVDVVLYSMQVKSRRTSWEFFRNRRHIRQQYLELAITLHDSHGDRSLLSSRLRELFAKLGDIERRLSPLDVLFYRSLVRVLVRRAIVHRTSYCQSCDRGPLLLNRIICTECSTFSIDNSGGLKLMDLCDCCASAHNDASDTRSAMQAVDASSLHRLVQLRRNLPDNKIYELLSVEDYALQNKFALTSDTPQCLKCLMPLSHPFWCCLECSSDPVCICLECNKKERRTYLSSLMKSVAEAQSFSFTEGPTGPTHRLWHTLILLRPPSNELLHTISVEKRLANLESGLQDIKALLLQLANNK